MPTTNPNYKDITAIGGTIALNLANYATAYVLVNSTSPLTLAGNWAVNFDATGFDGSTIPDGLEFSVLFGNIILNGHTITINGASLTALEALEGRTQVWRYQDSAWLDPLNIADADGTGVISGASLEDATVTLAKLENLTAADIILGNVSNRPTATAVTGDIGITNAGVTSISAGVIVNADVNAAAGIEVNKLEALTASKAVTTDGSGFIQAVNQIPQDLGGTNIDTSAATGFLQVAAGTWSVALLTDVRHLDNISFVTAQQGIYYIYFPFPCTVTAAHIRVTSVVGGTEAGSLLFQDNAANNMTGDNLTAGILTVAMSAAFGTGYTTTLESNNVFAAGESMRITSSKTTSGGVVSADITYTRLTLS